MVHIPPRIGEWSDFDGLRAIWQERLPAVVRAAAHSDFYRSRFGPDVSPVDLGRLSGLPLTTKADLRANHPFGMVAVPRRRLASYHESSGTSPGQATASFHTEADWAEMLDRFSRGRYNLSDSDTVLVRVPYAMVTIGHQVHAAARAAGALTVPADARSTAMTYPASCACCATWRSPSPPPCPPSRSCGPPAPGCWTPRPATTPPGCGR